MRKQLPDLHSRVRVKNYWFVVEECSCAGVDPHPSSCIALVPLGEGDIACAGVPLDSYQYTHGGSVFQAACLRAREIRTERTIVESVVKKFVPHTLANVLRGMGAFVLESDIYVEACFPLGDIFYWPDTGKLTGPHILLKEVEHFYKVHTSILKERVHESDFT